MMWIPGAERASSEPVPASPAGTLLYSCSDPIVRDESAPRSNVGIVYPNADALE
jgi:hypothetical protein